MIFIFLRTRSRELRPSGELAPPRPLLPPPRPPRLALRLPAGRQEGKPEGRVQCAQEAKQHATNALNTILPRPPPLLLQSGLHCFCVAVQIGPSPKFLNV